MSLVTLKEVLSEAAKRGSAIPAFNVDNLEILQSLMEAVEEENYPVIFAIGQAAIKDGKMPFLADAVRRFAFNSSIPIVLHLDHGQSIQQVVQALQVGFSSIMIDGSHLPLEENIKLTKQTIDLANAVGVSVEAELGAILGVEDNIEHVIGEDFLVKIEDVKDFTQAVKVDALAIGIGNAHGVYKGLPNLNFKLLGDINSLKQVPPLVLHGGSGIPENMIRKSIELGIRKINVATEIRMAYVSGLIKESTSEDFYTMSMAGKENVRKLAIEKIQLFKKSTLHIKQDY